jgi:hypothetical protein
MNNADRKDPEPSPAAQPRAAEAQSALFASLVLNQTQMALLMLGAVPHPETGERVREIEGARLLIDQLEMLEEKTRGNLTTAESRLLRESLTTLRMAFVEAVEQGAEPTKPAAPTEASPERPAVASGSPPADEGESRRKFTKKY